MQGAGPDAEVVDVAAAPSEQRGILDARHGTANPALGNGLHTLGNLPVGALSAPPRPILRAACRAAQYRRVLGLTEESQNQPAASRATERNSLGEVPA